MSETAEQHAEVGGQPPAKPPASGTGPGNVLRRAAAVFIRQREATILVVTVALLVYFSLASSTFLTASNISNLLSGYAAPIILLAIGEVLLLICGEIDLSVGFVLTFSPFLMHYLIDYYSVPVIPAILLCLLFGVIVGWVNAFLTVTVGLPSFITTLGTGFILYGLVLTTSNAYPANIPAKAAGYAKIFGTQSGFGQWSPIIWGVVLVIIFQIVLTRTRYGLHTIATGGNLLGARESGINVARVKYTAFMITGFMGALAGLQTAFYDNTIDPSAGQYTPMFFAVTAAVIGGTAMLGGTGTIIGAFLGAIVLATLQDGLSILGISANPLDIIFGAAIIIAMIANVRLARLRAAGRD
jgi:simple sugar transport system permease protein